jgi:hypothetical protein
MPGDSDYLLWTTGNTVRETTQNVLKLTEHRNWRTLTHIPLYPHRNQTFQKTI